MGRATNGEVERRSRIMAAAVVAVVFAVVCAGLALAAGLDAAFPQEDGSVSPDVVVDVTVPEDPFYVLLIGSDSRKGTALYTGRSNEHSQVDQRSDILTLVRVDPRNYVITLVTVPRDTELAGQYAKINEAFLEADPEKAVAAVGDLTGVYADYYAVTTFIGFEDLVDGLGGVEADVPRAVKVQDPSTAADVELEPGDDQHLDGSEALVLARARKEYGDNQDALRQVNVRALEEALIRKVVDGEVSAAAASRVFSSTTSSDLDVQVLERLAQDFTNHRDQVVIYSCTGPYKGEGSASGLWVVKEDPETWAQLMRVVDAGADPDGIVEEPSFE